MFIYGIARKKINFKFDYNKNKATRTRTRRNRATCKQSLIYASRSVPETEPEPDHPAPIFAVGVCVA